MPLDFLIVGSGLTGATIARLITDAGKTVRVIEQRDHLGGNVHDQLIHGVRVHTYGPHYFRTNNQWIWDFVNRFATWWRYEPCLQSEVDGQLYPWPPTEAVIDAFGGWGDLYQGEVRTFEDACLAMMPKQVYEAFVHGYTRKQWGRDPVELAPALAGRFEVRTTDLRLKPHRHQGIPTDGYTAFMHRLLDGIPVELNTPWDGDHQGVHVVYTGPLDAWFNHDQGHLEYRGQHRTHQWHPTGPLQPCGQVNNPGHGQHIRTIEWGHMDPKGWDPNQGTVLTMETPYTPTHPDGYEYPVPTNVNAELAIAYKRRARALHNVTICGRLGDYRYYDMDQAIGRAHRTAQRLLSK